MAKRTFTWITLFLSFSTWICCAFPILITLIAGASAVAGLVSAFPWLVPLTRHKDWIFIVVAILIILNGLILYWSKLKKECPIEMKETCQSGKNWSKIFFWITVGVYGIGVITAYILPWLMTTFSKE